MTTNEKIKKKAREFVEVGNIKYGDEMGIITLEECSTHMQGLLLAIARHVLAAEIEAEIRGLCFVYPELNGKGGITIQLGSNKDFALKRKIELERQLEEMKK